MTDIMNKFMAEDTSIFPFKLNPENTLDRVPPKVYVVKFDKIRGFYLDILKSRMDVPAKIYGSVTARAEKCVRTYTERETSTGILMTGDKGTGKSLLLNLICNLMIEQRKVPVLLIREPYVGAQFISFIEHIGECVMVFDEFGKLYTSSNDGDLDETVPSQKNLLTLLDGNDSIRRMIIMTENKTWDINEYILNRPGRVYYHFKYSKLDEDSVVQYCEDKGVPEIQDDIIRLSRTSKVFSFDILQSIAEEYLRFGGTVEEVVKDLNIDTRPVMAVQLEAVKVVRRSDKAEVEIADKNIIVVNDHHARISLKISDTPTKNTDLQQLHEQVFGVPISRDGDTDPSSSSKRVEEFYFDPSDPIYASREQLVFQTNLHTIYAKEVYIDNYSFTDVTV